MEYVTKKDWDPNNPEHVELMRLHLHGNGAARTPNVDEVRSARPRTPHPPSSPPPAASRPPPTPTRRADRAASGQA